MISFGAAIEHRRKAAAEKAMQKHCSLGGNTLNLYKDALWWLQVLKAL